MCYITIVLLLEDISYLSIYTLNVPGYFDINEIYKSYDLNAKKIKQFSKSTLLLFFKREASNFSKKREVQGLCPACCPLRTAPRESYNFYTIEAVRM
jgi:hypothetical protein